MISLPVCDIMREVTEGKGEKMANLYELLHALNSGITPGTGEPVDVEELRSDKVREEIIMLAQSAGLVMADMRTESSFNSAGNEILGSLKVWRRDKASEFGVPETAVLDDVLLREIAHSVISSERDLVDTGILPEGKYELFGQELFDILRVFMRQS